MISTLHPIPLGALAAGASVPVDFSDWQLEQRIDFQAGLMAMALTREEQIAAQDELRRLHAMRSLERIEQMEREQGLR